MAFKVTFVGLAAVLVAAALMQVGLAGASSTGGTVHASQSKLGRVLVDARGHSVYLFGKDKGGRSSCYGACAAYWPPLIASAKPRAGAGTKASLLGWTKRMDGRWQVAYNRHPLYTFFEDMKKGQTNGEGLHDFGAEWDLVSPTGSKVEAGETMNGAGGNTSSGGYGYGR